MIILKTDKNTPMVLFQATILKLFVIYLNVLHPNRAIVHLILLLAPNNIINYKRISSLVIY